MKYIHQSFILLNKVGKEKRVLAPNPDSQKREVAERIHKVSVENPPNLLWPEISIFLFIYLREGSKSHA